MCKECSFPEATSLGWNVVLKRYDLLLKTCVIFSSIYVSLWNVYTADAAKGGGEECLVQVRAAPQVVCEMLSVPLRMGS